MSTRQYKVMVWTPNGQVPVIVTATHQQEAFELVSSMYAALIAKDSRYSILTYVEPL